MMGYYYSDKIKALTTLSSEIGPNTLKKILWKKNKDVRVHLNY